jgi:hypothetical protein
MRQRMRARLAGRTALVALVAVTALPACGDESGSGTPPVEPAIVDEEVLAQFVDAEKRIDASQLTTALGAGADLGKASAAIRGDWDAGRKRVLASLGPDGVVPTASGTSRRGSGR